MIDRLLEIGKINPNKLNQDGIFNSTLPIRLKVLAKKGGMKYLLQVGTKILETKSQRNLEVGGKYFATMKTSKVGNIILSSLSAEPKLSKTPLNLDFIQTKELLSKNSFKEIAEFASEQIVQSHSKEEFMSWAFVLSGLQKNILSFCIQDEDKEHYIQIKKKKSSLDFFALFPHLGSLTGTISPHLLHLTVAYDCVARFLYDNLDDLKWRGEVKINVSNAEISPLFFMQEQLLNLSI